MLLDEYEVGMTVEDYDPLFAGLKSRLVPLLSKIMKSEVEIPRLPDEMTFPADAQEAFCNKVSKAMGFDFEAGRMDRSTHPFCAGLWPDDTDLPHALMKDPFSCLYAVMHESGHGVYEQGLPREHSFRQLEQRFLWEFTNLKVDSGKTKSVEPRHFGMLPCLGSVNNSLIVRLEQ